MTLHFYIDVNRVDTKIKYYVIIASLKNESTSKLVCLLISRLPGSSLRMHVESLDKPYV